MLTYIFQTFQFEILGGLLIGFAAAIPLAAESKIAGVSGYAAAALRPSTEDGKKGLLFVLGLILSGIIWKSLGGPIPEASQSIDQNLLLWSLAGLLVGFGARLGGGCTSGHGVCGLGRSSVRSFTAVLTFMIVAFATNFALGYFK